MSTDLSATDPQLADPQLADPQLGDPQLVGETPHLGDDEAEAPATTPTSMATPIKERHSLTLDQRRALRRWAKSQTSRPSHKACIEWFQAQYQQTISQSTVSHSLSPKYARLDGDPQLSGSRLRFGNWPDVEKLVLVWHQQVVHNGRNPTNDELADKAKSIFQQLPRYRDEQAPEFSPGWIHRFKKRYGLLIRRQRRPGLPNLAEDIAYLTDAIPRFMNVSADTSPVAIREAVLRVVGVEASLANCARVRDEIVHRLENPQDASAPFAAAAAAAAAASAVVDGESHDEANGSALVGSSGNGAPDADGDTTMYGDATDPELVLQNALRAMQEEEADAEALAAAERVERQALANPALATGAAYALAAAASSMATPVHPATPRPNGTTGAASANTTTARFAVTPSPSAPVGGAGADPSHDLTLTPIPSGGPVSNTDQPLRCPFCLNQRMLRTIKEAVEHMSTHVVV